MSLVEHGITTSKADYWIHFFPLEPAAYWYRVDQIRKYIKAKRIAAKDAKSKNGDVTGRGYLVRKNTYPVSRLDVPCRYVDDFDWSEMTDREKGLTGERIVEALIEHRIIRFPIQTITAARSREDQYSAVDYRVSYFQNFSIEIKTECVESKNLYIQTHEGNHKVHLLRQNSEVVERITEAPEFLADAAGQQFDDDIPF